MHRRRIEIYLILLCAIALIFGTSLLKVHADTATSSSATVEQLQQQIDDHNTQIAALEKQIAQYQAQATQSSQQAATLKNLINTLNISKQKLEADITLTQTQISKANLTITQLNSQISDKQQQINTNKAALCESIRELNQSDGNNFLETVLTAGNVSDFLNDVQALQDIQGKVKTSIDTIQGLTQDLQSKQNDTLTQKNSLVTYQSTLSDQKQAVVTTAQQKTDLLTQTKNQESAYQKLVAQTQARETALEQELYTFESQLNLKVNPSSIPKTQTGVLSWPLSIPIRITQYFGNTDFSTANPQIYSGMGHNGVDIAAPIGTPIKAALSGTVVDTGDTDLACPGASFGRWILIRHDNGLSSLYAHLSVIGVKAGQVVQTGDTIGLTGLTGYTTGPHLHFTVYATEGVEVIDRPSVACDGKIYHMPVADFKAYLNPLSFLPPLK